MNSNFLLFVIFYTIMALVYAGMQLITYRLYQRWLRYTFLHETAQRRARLTGQAVLLVGNLLFLPRFIFILSEDLHNSAFIQQYIVEPGGIFFATLGCLAAAGVLFFMMKGLRYVLRSNFIKPEIKTPVPPGIPETAGPSITKKPPDDAAPPPDETPLMSRRRFIRNAGIVGFSAPFLINTGLSAATHRHYVITRQTLHFPQLPSGLEGLRLVHISDLHSGIFMNKQQIQEIYEIVNGLHPNLIAFTGDFADNHVSEIPNVRDTISMLRSDYGLFGCPGNHDHYASIDALVEAFDDKPITLLRNQTRNFTINGENISMLGIDDPGEAGRNYADFDGTYAQAAPESFKILLSHRPHMFDTARQHGIDLTLAGHTHGGQIGTSVAGVDIYPIDWFHDYPRGHFRKGNHHLYVNVGVGLVAAPIRLVRPEITELTLTSDASKVKRSVTDA